ncbi:MAG: orotidine-5'-phosphate decarboxylase [Pigmentiphaga sp.]
MSFYSHLQEAWQRQSSLLTVGLDPDLARLPAELRDEPDAILRFCREIVDLTAPYAVAFKPQIAYFAALRAEGQLEALCTYIREQYPHLALVLDAKRGDIGATATQYAREAFERYQAHAVTVNPYMGFDSIAPYLQWRDRGVFVLCRTSNPGGSDLQFLEIEGDPLYLRVAELVAGPWQRGAPSGQLGLVVGATYPDELARVRARVGDDVPVLVPGIGAQGGDVVASVKAGRNTAGAGLLINSSRAILYTPGDDWRAAVAEAARTTRDVIEAARREP